MLWEPWQVAQKGFLDKSPVSSKPKGNTEEMTRAKAWMQDRTVFSRCDIRRGKPPSTPQDSRPAGVLYVPDHKAYCVSIACPGLPFFSPNCKSTGVHVCKPLEHYYLEYHVLNSLFTCSCCSRDMHNSALLI